MYCNYGMVAWGANPTCEFDSNFEGKKKYWFDNHRSDSPGGAYHDGHYLVTRAAHDYNPVCELETFFAELVGGAIMLLIAVVIEAALVPAEAAGAAVVVLGEGVEAIEDVVAVVEASESVAAAGEAGAAADAISVDAAGGAEAMTDAVEGVEEGKSLVLHLQPAPFRAFERDSIPGIRGP